MMDTLLFASNLPSLGMQKIVDLIDYFDYPIDIKDIKTKKYIYNNLAASHISGLSKEERVGMDILDIAKIHHIKESEISKIIYADHQVNTSEAPIILNHIFLDTEGTLIVDKVVKRPILSKSGHSIAILSYAFTVTPSIDLTKLYVLYRSYYRKKEAIKRFLHHLKLEKDFIEPPTDQELRTLLAIQSNIASSKYIAKVMNLSPRTIEEYKSRLHDKLRFISFEQLLMMLRSYGKEEIII